MIDFSRKLYIKKGGQKKIRMNIFQNTQDLLVSLGNSYSEDQLMQFFLDKFHQGGNIFHKELATR